MAFGGSIQQKMSEETFDFMCTTCLEDDKKVQAIKYCVECSGYICQPCTVAHKKFPALKNHNLLDVDQANQATGQRPSLPEFPTERCSIHKGKVVDMYCESHDVVGCYVCFAKDHKSCQDIHIHSVPDMIDTIYKISNCKQTQMHLKDMIDSMQLISFSKNTRLQALVAAKKEAIDKINTFQKAIEAILRKLADASRSEVESASKKLEKEIVNDVHSADSIVDDLKMTDGKLQQSEGNRAQQFVCAKIAQEKIVDANSKKICFEEELKYTKDISFIQDQSLMEYITALHGIGTVQTQKYREKKHDLYKIKGCRDISIRLPDDNKSCNSCGCCLTEDNQLLVTDRNNKKLKRVDIHKMSVVDYCSLDSTPVGLCCISKLEVAVACKNISKIQFVSVLDKMILTREVKTSHRCYGIAYNNGKLYVTDEARSFYIYNITGILLNTISQDKAGNELFKYSGHVSLNDSRNRVFVGNWRNGLVCFDEDGNYLSTYEDSDLKGVEGACVDGRGNIFVVGRQSDNILQMTEHGQKIGEIVVGKRGPCCVCFHQGLNRMYVTMADQDAVKMYELA